jgi:hypothetical protein
MKFKHEIGFKCPHCDKGIWLEMNLLNLEHDTPIALDWKKQGK